MRVEASAGLPNNGFFNGVLAALLAAIIIGTLYLGRSIFVPIALAILLSFVLAPLTRLLQSWYLPRGLSVVVVVLLAFLAIFAVGGVIATQLAQLAEDLPRYEQTMREKIKSLRWSAATGGTLERAADVLRDLGKEIDPLGKRETTPPDGRSDSTAPQPRPIPVEIRDPPSGALEGLARVIGPLLHPLAATGIVVIFVIFILLQREDLRNRFIKLAGSRDLQKTTAALDDAARRLSRLFLTQLALNSAFGVLIGIGLWLIGVPSPVLWGILAAVLRFVPYIGAIIAAAFPMALAVAVDPGWTMLMWTAALFVIIEPALAHLIEPLVYGHSTGLSPVAVVAAVTFWTALWGTIGLVLAIPLTICLVVLGRHVEQLAFLDVMFGDRPALSPAEIFYQRMLAGDPSEAVDKAEEFLKEKPLLAYYDDVALKGMKLAQTDAERGSLATPRIEAFCEAVRELVDDLSDWDDRLPSVTPAKDTEAAAAVETARSAVAESIPVLREDELAAAWRTPTPVLCVAGRSELDEGPAIMLTQLLRCHGLGARVEPAAALSTARIGKLDGAGVAMVCLCYLDSHSLAHVRYAIRRMRRRFPDVRILYGCWMCEPRDAAAHERVNADVVATTLAEALRACIETARAGANAAGRRPASSPARESVPAS